MRKLNPRVVYCSLSGYGSEGELAHRPGHDINYLAESGAYEVVRSDGLPVGDLAGASAAVSRILAALYMVARTGRGSEVEISIAGALRDWVDAIGGDRCTEFLTVYTAPHYGAFRTKDNQQLVIGVAQEQRLWANLITALGRAEWAVLDHDARGARRDEIASFLSQRISELTASELSNMLASVDTCWSFVKKPSQAADLPGPFPMADARVPDFNEHGPAYRSNQSAS